jgi:hypothetical protein
MTKSKGFKRLFFDGRRGAPSRSQASDSASLVAEEQLYSFIALRYAGGAWPATDVATIAYFLRRLGLNKFDGLGRLDPGTLSFNANAAKTVNAAFQMSELKKELLHVPIPVGGQGRQAGARLVDMHPCSFLAQILVEEFLREGPANVIEAVSAIRTPNWLQHEQRLKCEADGDIAIPFGVFVDGAAWRGKGVGSRESVINYFTNLLGFKRRRTVTVMRKDFMCGTWGSYISSFKFIGVYTYISAAPRSLEL